MRTASRLVLVKFCRPQNWTCAHILAAAQSLQSKMCSSTSTIYWQGNILTLRLLRITLFIEEDLNRNPPVQYWFPDLPRSLAGNIQSPWDTRKLWHFLPSDRSNSVFRRTTYQSKFSGLGTKRAAYRQSEALRPCRFSSEHFQRVHRVRGLL